MSNLRRGEADGTFEANLLRVLGARAAKAGHLPDHIQEQALALCLDALRPRNRWPENTRFYATIKARLSERPLGVLFAVAAGTTVALYLGFGPSVFTWLGSLLRGPA
mgnify:CR=1 FL=1